MKKRQLSTTTLTFLAGVAGAGPLPAEPDALNRHRGVEDAAVKAKGGIFKRIRQLMAGE